MADNHICFICNTEPAVQTCICSSDLPLFCGKCRQTHEEKPGFHFALPEKALDYVNAQNQHQTMLWLLSVQNSQEKLRGNIPKIDKCRREIEALQSNNPAEFDPIKAKALEALKELKAVLTPKIQEVFEETATNAYIRSYQPTTFLSSLIWVHSREQSSDPISIFTYQIQTEK